MSAFLGYPSLILFPVLSSHMKWIKKKDERTWNGTGKIENLPAMLPAPLRTQRLVFPPFIFSRCVHLMEGAWKGMSRPDR